jgi:tetratricopeptide (TPR) repeat protein
MDFGASLDYRRADQAPPMASGTPLYMAPEVVLGAAPDTRADLYSMGALFYRVLVGSLPIDVETWDDLQAVHREAQPPPRVRLADDPGGRIGGLIERLLSIDPEKRPDPAQVLVEIQRIREAPHRRFRRIALGSIASVLVAGLVVASIGFFRAERALEQAEVEQANTEAVSEFLQRVLHTPSSSGRARDMTVEDMLRFAALDAEDSLADQPRARAVVHRVLADSLNVLRRPALALEQIRLARLTLVEHELSMPDESRHLDLLAISAAELEERHDEAIQMADAFIDRHLVELGDDHLHVRWARLYRATNLLALSRHQQALEIMESHFVSIPAPETARQDFGYAILQTWVNVYKGLGRYHDAVARAEEAVAWLDRYPRARPIYSAYALTNLAMVLSDVNRQDRAIEVFKTALPLHERVFGTGSSSHVGTLVNLASAQRESGRVPEAQTSLEQALDLMRRHPDSTTREKELVVQMNLANILNANGMVEQSEAMMRKSLARMRAHWGSAHRNVLIQEYNLAELLSQQARFDEARQLAEQTLVIKRSTLGESHPLTLLSMDNLGVALNGLGRGKDALELHDQALTALTQRLGSEHPYVLLIERHRMATLLDHAPGQLQTGAIEALIERHEQALGAEHFDTSKARALLDQR